jgi:anaerobic selenocysteine-containing dehydrogenase
MPKRPESRERESPTRRTFIKGVAAGAAAAAGLAAGSSPASAATRTGARHLRVAFDQGRFTTIEDVHKAVEAALGPSGCTRCGFDGIDLRLRKEEILDPEPAPWVVATWEGEGF